MFEKRIPPAFHRSANFGFRFFALAMHASVRNLRRPVVRLSVILLAGTLAATLAHAQNKSTMEIQGNQPGETDRITAPSDAPDSNPGTDTEANPNQSGGVEKPDQEQQPAAGQTAVDPDAESGQFADIDQFVTNDDVYESPIGALLQRNCARLAQGQLACGLAVLEIRPGGPAALAGLRPYSGLVHTLLGAGIVGTAMVFPPALAALGLVEQSHVGETYDLILGVDGQRIRRIRDFQDAISEARFGDLIYVTVLRRGTRLQIPMRIMQRANHAE
jgi:hypothetical protein